MDGKILEVLVYPAIAIVVAIVAVVMGGVIADERRGRKQYETAMAARVSGDKVGGE